MVVFSRLNGVVRSLGTPGSVTLERSNGVTTNDEGGAVRLPPTLRVLEPTVVHPISGRDRNLMPEGVRTREIIVVHVNEILRTSVEFGELADVLIHKPSSEVEPSRYIVNTVENWGHVSNSWRAFASREPKS
jgi:hypothetical protein